MKLSGEQVVKILAHPYKRMISVELKSVTLFFSATDFDVCNGELCLKA